MKYRALLLAACTLLLAACSTDPTTPLEVSSRYDASSYAANAAQETTLRADLSALVTLIKTGRTQGTKVDESQLTALASALPLGAYAAVVNASIPELAKASGGSYDPRKSVAENGQGGVYGGYLFDETGLEFEQVIEKGLFGAMLYPKAVALMTADATSADVDRILALYGADPSFPNSDKVATPDRLLAAYAARRDKNDGNGVYTTIAAAFRKAKAAAAAGSDYNAEKLDAFTTIRTTWERALMATVVNYLLTGITTFSSTSPTDAAIASALHACGEAIGFCYGMSAVPQAQRRITDTEIQSLAALMQYAPPTGSTMYRLVTEPVTAVAQLQEAVQKIATIYGYSASDIEDFRSNWVNVQQR